MGLIAEERLGDSWIFRVAPSFILKKYKRHLFEVGIVSSTTEWISSQPVFIWLISSIGKSISKSRALLRQRCQPDNK